MKKDIQIPPVNGIYVAAVREFNKEFRSQDWNAYIINDKNVPLEMVMIVTRGYDEQQATATMRHSIKVLPAKSYAKIEFLQDDVLRLNNEFMVSFFEENKLFEKNFVFGKNTVKIEEVIDIPIMKDKGILAG